MEVVMSVCIALLMRLIWSLLLKQTPLLSTGLTGIVDEVGAEFAQLLRQRSARVFMGL